MSIINPLTASIDIQRTLVPKAEVKGKENPLKPSLGVFSDDIVEISILGLEKQQKEAQVTASKAVEDIANEEIRVNSSIGKARSVGHLTKHQATDLYNKISSLL